MEKASLPRSEPIARPESTVSLDESDFESHEDEENVVYTPRSSHFGDTNPDLPPSYDESQAAHAEAQARSQLLPGRENHSDVTVYRTELPPEPCIPPRETPSVHGKEAARPPSPNSGPSVLLHQALDFTLDQPAMDARYAHELTRPIAIPSLPGNVDPVKFARFYATILHSHFVTPAQFMDFIDGLNALCTACSASSAQLRSLDLQFELLDSTAITRETLIPAYLTQTNITFFAPRGLEARILTLPQIAALVKIPTDHGIRTNMLTDAVRAHRAGADVPTAAHGAATAAAQALEPYIEPLSFAVPEPRTQIEAMNSVASRLASLSLTTPDPRPRDEMRRHSSRTNSSAPAAAEAGPSTPRQRHIADARSSTEPQLPFWHPVELARRATELGEKQGKFWGDWGEKQGKFWEEWGEKQVKFGADWGEKQEKRWEKWGKGVEKWWEKWGEDFERRMSAEGSCGSAGAGRGSTEGRDGRDREIPGQWPEQHSQPELESDSGLNERPNAAPWPGMPGVFPLAPGPRAAMMLGPAAMGVAMNIGSHAARGRGGMFGPHVHMGHHPHGRMGHHPHDHMVHHSHGHMGHPQFPARGGFGGSRFAGGHSRRGEDAAHGGARGGRFAYYNTEPQHAKDEEEKDDDSDTTSISSSDSSSTAVSSSSHDAEAVFAQKVREIERYAAAARAKGKRKDEDIENERQKALRKADEERSKAVAEVEEKRIRKELRAERRAWKKEWKRTAKAEAKTFKKQFRAEKRAIKTERKNMRRGRDRSGRRESRDERRERRRKEWESRWEVKQKQWELRRQELERGRKMWESRWEAMRKNHERTWQERRARDQQDATANARGLEEREINALAGGVPGAWPDARDRDILRDDTLTGAEDILWIVIGNLEA